MKALTWFGAAKTLLAAWQTQAQMTVDVAKIRYRKYQNVTLVEAAKTALGLPK